MNFIVSNIKWIMLVSGALTCTMIYAVVAPEEALMSTFGVSLGSSALAEIVVRSWGALVTLVGAMLIYAAFNPQYRYLVITVACISKAVFVGLILSFGEQYMASAGATIGFDALVVLIFIIYLIKCRAIS